MPIRFRKLPDGTYLMTDEPTSKEKMELISEAAWDKKRLLVTYLKKTTGEVVKRHIAPYELKGNKLYASCREHSNQIHSFIKGRIIDAKVTEKVFSPKWPNKIPWE